MKIPFSRQEAHDLCKHLDTLYQEQAAVASTHAYLRDHSRHEVIKHHVNVFAWYSQYLPETGSILDWGCNHGPDSCFLRRAFGDRFKLYGCDFEEESEFRVFRDYSRFHYTKLTNATELPYPDSSLDVIIGSGALEHAAMDQEALKSLYRVLKPHGLLIISYLPYRWSLDEWRKRRTGIMFRRRPYDMGEIDMFHRRLYGMEEIDTLLKRTGFYPFDTRFQTFVPNVYDGKKKSWLRSFLQPFRYPWFSHSVLCCAARKVLLM